MSRLLAARDRGMVDFGYCPIPWVSRQGNPFDTLSPSLCTEGRPRLTSHLQEAAPPPSASEDSGRVAETWLDMPVLIWLLWVIKGNTEVTREGSFVCVELDVLFQKAGLQAVLSMGQA